MNEYVNIATTKLFQEGNWEIHDNPLRHPRLSPGVSRIVHYCSGDFCHVWSHINVIKQCPACEETIPDSIQTLWTLHNFDIDFSHKYPGPRMVR